MANTSNSVKPSGREYAVTILAIKMATDLTSALCYSCRAAFSPDPPSSASPRLLKGTAHVQTHACYYITALGFFTPTTTIRARMLLMMGLASTRTPPSPANRISDTSKMKAFIAITTSSL